MNNLIQRLKGLPWRLLLQNAAIATLLVMAVELLLKWGLSASDTVLDVLQILSDPPMGLIIPIMIAIGMSTLSVYLFELQKQQHLLNSSTLWALVFCLLFCLFIKSLFHVSLPLISLSRNTFVCLLIGVFWKGRPYWR